MNKKLEMKCHSVPTLSGPESLSIEGDAGIEDKGGSGQRCGQVQHDFAKVIQHPLNRFDLV